MPPLRTLRLSRHSLLGRITQREIDTTALNFLLSTMLSHADAAVNAVYHSDWGLIVATLIRQFGDFDVAEESAPGGVRGGRRSMED